MTTRPLESLRILYRAETALRHAQLRQLLRRGLLLSVALGFGLIGLAVLHMALLDTLAESWGFLEAGLIIGGVDVAIMLLFLRFALAPLGNGPEVRLADELRQEALQSLSREATEAAELLREVTGTARRAMALLRLLRGGFGGLLEGLLSLLASTRESPTPETTQKQNAVPETGTASD